MLTERQISKRGGYLGASDVPVVLGISPWKTAWELAAEKLGRIEPPPPTTEAEIGKLLEGAVLDFAESKLGKLTRRGTERRIPDTPILVHLDAIRAGRNEPVEAKTSGIVRGRADDSWGDGGTNEVPMHVYVQCQVILAATKAEICWVPALLAGRGLELYRIEADELVQDEAIKSSVEWWERYIEGGEPVPTDAPPSLETLSRLHREPKKWADVPHELILAWEDARRRRLDAEKAEEAALAKVLLALGDAEAAKLPDGRAFTYYEQSRKYVDKSKIPPELVEQFLCESKYRVARIISKQSDRP